MKPSVVQAWQVLQDGVTGRAAGGEQRLHSEWEVSLAYLIFSCLDSLGIRRTCYNTNFATSTHLQRNAILITGFHLIMGMHGKAASLLQGQEEQAASPA